MTVFRRVRRATPWRLWERPCRTPRQTSHRPVPARAAACRPWFTREDATGRPRQLIRASHGGLSYASNCAGLWPRSRKTKWSAR